MEQKPKKNAAQRLPSGPGSAAYSHSTQAHVPGMAAPTVPSTLNEQVPQTCPQADLKRGNASIEVCGIDNQAIAIIHLRSGLVLAILMLAG